MLPGIVCSTSDNKRYWLDVRKINVSLQKQMPRSPTIPSNRRNPEIPEKPGTLKVQCFRNFLVQLFEWNFFLAYAFVSDMMCSNIH